MLDVPDGTYILCSMVSVVLLANDMAIDARGPVLDTRVAIAGATHPVANKMVKELELEISLTKSVAVGGTC